MFHFIELLKSKKTEAFAIRSGLFILFAFSFFITGCKDTQKDILTVDFDKQSSTSEDVASDSLNVLNIAIAAIISPKETYILYEELFKYLSRNIDKKINILQKKTYKEVNMLIEGKKVDMAFICTGAYIDIAEKTELLAVPVCNGKPYYQAYIIANTASNVYSFEDFRGKTFVFTDPMSFTGKAYAEIRKKETVEDEVDFFSTTYFSGSHDISIQLVAKNIIDGASIDGLIFDYMKKNDAGKVANVRIIEKSANFGIPPVVVSKSVTPELKAKLQYILINMHKDQYGSSILEKLDIDSFIVAGDTLYDNVRKCVARYDIR